MNLNSHWDLQSKRLLIPLERYHGVIRFASLQEGMHAFLRSHSIRPRPDALTALHPSDRSRQTSASSLIRDFYTADATRRVFRLFERDFESLCYPAELPRS